MAHVLIVDDEPGIRFTMSEFLSDDGHDVLTEGTIEGALTVLAENDIDVVISDIFLGPTNGLKLVEQIRREHPDIPIILITGEPTLDSAVHALRSGAFNYLYKPVKSEAICAAVNSAAQIKKIKDDNKRLWEENRLQQQRLEELVTQRTRQLRQSEEAYRLLSERAQDMIWRTDSKGVVQYVNPAVKRLLGYEQEEAIGIPIERYLTKASRKNVYTWMSAALAADPPREAIKGEVEYIHKEGNIVASEFNVTILRDEDGSIISLEGITRDFRKHVDERRQLAYSAELYRTILEQSNLGTLIYSDNKVLYANEHCLSLFGYSKAEMERWNHSDLAIIVHAEDLAHLLQLAEKRLNSSPEESKVVNNYVFRGLHREGHSIYLDLTSIGIHFQQKPAVLIHVIEISQQEWERRRNKVVSD